METLRQFCQLRSESISKQLETGETTTVMNYADASGLTISNMGSMGGMGGKGGFEGGFPGRPSDTTGKTQRPERNNNNKKMM